MKEHANDEKLIIKDLRKFYQKYVKFENYEPIQKMTQKDLLVLKGIIGKSSEKILELGCGTGRLFLEMKKEYPNITGIDLTQRHIKIIRKTDPVAKVFLGNWHKTGFQKEEFDAIYSLGRNIAHDYLPIDQITTFIETHRILKRRGIFIFDIPNREKGSYKNKIIQYANEVGHQGRYGLICDSIDKKRFVIRYVYSHEDIAALAQIAGFEIIHIHKEDLETGYGNENIYYVLKKI